jgi:hypothetical protein
MGKIVVGAMRVLLKPFLPLWPLLLLLKQVLMVRFMREVVAWGTPVLCGKYLAW